MLKGRRRRSGSRSRLFSVFFDSPVVPPGTSLFHFTASAVATLAIKLATPNAATAAPSASAPKASSSSTETRDVQSSAVSLQRLLLTIRKTLPASDETVACAPVARNPTTPKASAAPLRARETSSRCAAQQPHRLTAQKLALRKPSASRAHHRQQDAREAACLPDCRRAPQENPKVLSLGRSGGESGRRESARRKRRPSPAAGALPSRAQPGERRRFCGVEEDLRQRRRETRKEVLTAAAGRTRAALLALWGEGRHAGDLLLSAPCPGRLLKRSRRVLRGRWRRR